MAAPRPQGNARQAQTGDILIVIHEFVARSPDELSLAKGDRIELIEGDDEFGDGWYLGRHVQNGQTGLFPEVYTTLAPKPALSGAAMAQANAARLTSQGFTSDGLDARTPPAGNPPIAAYESFSLPHQPAAPTPTVSPATVQQPISPASPTAFPGSLRSTTGGFSRLQAQQPQSSNVMDETMNVIDEHITDMSRLEVPGSIVRRTSADSGSQYSEDARRPSYVNGAETDEEEEDGALSRAKVLKWSPEKVAQYLENVGVEKSHCEVFVEEEFSGEVLLEIDQSTILLQELKLGSIGRRMKTWQKIKALQEAVKNAELLPPQATAVSPTAPFSPTQPQRTSTFNTPNFSRGATHAPKGSSMDFVDQIARLPSPTQPGAQAHRPSAASIRSMAQSAHSRRQSSVDQTQPLPSHAKQQSFDRGWTMANRGPAQDARQQSYSNNNRPMSTAHLHSMSSDRAQFDNRQSQAAFDPALEPDKGYTSGSELDVRRQRDLKSPGHEKTVSDVSPGAQTRYESNRIVSEPVNGAMSPMITKLGEPSDVPRTQRMSDIKEKEEVPSSTSERKGLRAISDAITGREKARVQNDTDPTQSPTLGGSSTGTPSTISKADFEDANKSDMATPLPPIGALAANRRKSGKKTTSAYVRGLEKKTPQEQMIGCDHSGWMKKKSSSLMTTWKPRFFVLKGRRLSYYYSLDDKEEKGLIDISNHRVLPAENDFLTNFHATLTRVGNGSGSPTMPTTASPASASAGFSGADPSSPKSPNRASTVPNTPLMKGDNQTFIFKLVPPRSGLSKAVNFTKPTVHYFAVPSLAEGRQWMAALMKATIDRDESARVVTTYQQKTISLEKARARRERPPELREVDEAEESAATAGGDEGYFDQNGAMNDGARLIELKDRPSMLDEDVVGSTRTSSVVSGMESSYNGGDARSISNSGSGSGSHTGTGTRTSASLRNSSSLRHSTAARDSNTGQGLGIQGWNGDGAGEAPAQP